MKDKETINKVLFIFSFINILIYIIWGISYIFNQYILTYSSTVLAIINIPIILFFYLKLTKNKESIVNFRNYNKRFIRLIITAIGCLFASLFLLFSLNS